MEDRLNKKSWYEHLHQQTEQFWLDMINEQFIKNVNVTIKGVPSKSEAERIQKEQEDRVALRKEQVGETGLKKWEQAVENAKNQNEVSIN